MTRLTIEANQTQHFNLPRHVAQIAAQAQTRTQEVENRYRKRKESSTQENQRQERKKKFLSISDIFIALPGGGGTIEEISLVISASQLNLIKNKI